MADVNNVDISEFLTSARLEQYAARLIEEGFDCVGDLRGISLSELVDFDIKKGHARRLVNALADLFGPDAASSGGTESKEEEYRYDGPKKTVSLLLYGQTGVGKSTLLKALNDYISGVSFGNISTTDKTARRGDSQTQESSLKNMNNSEWDVNIIDTPGIGDTNGTDVDDQHMNNIADYLNDKEFNAVCILIKRGETRSITLLRYVINELRQTMPKEVSRNFIVIMTRAEVPLPDADTMVVIDRLGLPIDNIIPVNNIAYEEMDLSKFSDGSVMVQSIKSKQRLNYTENQGNLQRLLELAHTYAPYKGNKVVALKVKRNKLRSQVSLLKVKLDAAAKFEFTIEQQQHLLQEALRDASKARGAIEKTKSVTRTRHVKHGGVIRTYCMDCRLDCHESCGLSWNTDLTSCAVMRGNNCGECGCTVSRHSHKGWKEESWQEEVPYQDTTEIRNMNAAESNATIIRDRQRQFDRKLLESKQERSRLILGIRELYTELDRIAILGYNDSYENFMEESKKAVESDPLLKPHEKQRKLGMFANALAEFRVMKRALGL